MNKDMKKRKDQEKKKYTPEEKEAHPELYREIRRSRRERLRELRKYKDRIKHRKLVEHLNREAITHLVQASSIILAILYITFGILSALSILGIRESKTWLLYEATYFFGWEGNAITGFILIIIGIVNIWSIPYYFLDNEQKADSYLIIGTGLGSLFGIIYILIILADVLNSLVDCIADCAPFTITTSFYFPILLGILTIPIFRILILRHTLFAPSEEKEEEEKFDEEEYEKLRNERSFFKHKKHWGRRHHRNKRRKW